METFGRVIVVAPTRSTCVNLHHLIGLPSLPDTLLMRECREELDTAINELPLGGFGIVAGTGTGKSAAIREICHRVLETAPQVGIVTLEHQATDDTPAQNVLVITPGVALMWAKKGKITKNDLVVLDEIHQTSDHLELAMALTKRAECTFAWMSATVDPEIYQSYLKARRVIACSAYDETRRADVTYSQQGVTSWLQLNWNSILEGKRGVAIFVPTRSEAEAVTKKFSDQGVYTDFYHGGEPAEKLRAFISGEIPRPYVIAMTSAGASSLNLSGLDTVVIVDTQFREEIEGGRRRLVSRPLETNTLLQMAGRVDGRAVSGEVYILTDRFDLDLRSMKPEVPRFQLGGSLEQLALASALLKLDARDLDLIGNIDHDAYDSVFTRLTERGIIAMNGSNPRLTQLGRQIERLPLAAPWGEIVIRAQSLEDEALLKVVCLTACTGELYQLTGGPKWKRGKDKRIVLGSDHLTAHNVVAEAICKFGKRSPHGCHLQGKPFGKWCKEFGYSQKEIQSSALLLGSLYKQLHLTLPEPESFAPVTKGGARALHGAFIELLAIVQSLDYVRDGVSAQGRLVFGNSDYGVTHGGSVLGTTRYWNDRRGVRRASIEGTEIPLDVVKRNARRVLARVLSEEDDGETATVLFDLWFADMRLDQVSDCVPMSSVPQDALRVFRNNQQWKEFQNNPNKPALTMPNLSALNPTVGEVVAHPYGSDAVSGEPLLAYGTVASNHHYYGSGGSHFTTKWAQTKEEADRIRDAAVYALANVLDSLSFSDEARREVAERERFHQEATPLVEKVASLTKADLFMDVPHEVRQRLYRARQLPYYLNEATMSRWTNEATAAIAAVEAELQAAKERKEQFEHQLNETALPLRNKANELLREHEQKLTDTLYERLDALDVDDTRMPGNLDRLNEWIEEAKTAIAEAEKFLSTPQETVSADAFAALAAKFGRTK